MPLPSKSVTTFIETGPGKGHFHTEHRRGASKASIVGSIAAAAVLVTGGWYALHRNQERFERADRLQSASEHLRNAAKSLIAITGGPGVHGYETPAPAADRRDILEIPEGTTVIVERPVESQTKGWIAAVRPDIRTADLHTAQARREATAYFNLSELSKAGHITVVPLKHAPNISAEYITAHPNLEGVGVSLSMPTADAQKLTETLQSSLK